MRERQRDRERGTARAPCGRHDEEQGPFEDKEHTQSPARFSSAVFCAALPFEIHTCFTLRALRSAFQCAGAAPLA